MAPKKPSARTRPRRANQKPRRLKPAPRRAAIREAAPAPPPAPRDPEVFEVHQQFIAVMENDRLLSVSAELRGHYLTVMRSLTAKLAVSGKPLSEIVSEMMTEAAPIIFRLMQQ